MNRGHKIFKNLVYLYSMELGAKAVLFVVFLLTVNHLGDVGFGQYAFATAFTGIFSVGIDAGMMAYIAREVAVSKSRYDFFLTYALSWKLPLSILTFLAMGLILWVLGYTSETFTLVALAGLIMILDNVSTLLRSFFQAFETMEYMAVPRFIEKCFLLGFLFYAFRVHPSWVDARTVLEITLGVTFAGMIVTFLLVHWRLPKFHLVSLKFSEWVRFFSNSLPFAAFNLFGLIYLYFDTLLLSQFKGDAAVGWYNAAYQPVLVLYFIAGLLMTALYPVMSDYYRHAKESLTPLVNEALRFLFFLSLPMAVGLFLIAERAMPLAFGAEFDSGVPALKILAWVLIFAFFNCCISTFMNAVNRQNLNLWTTGIGLVFNVGTNLYFIPHYGVTGAAITTLATEILVFSMAFFWMGRMISLRFFMKHLPGPILCSVLMVLTFTSFGHLPLWGVTLLSALTYVLFALVFRVFGKREFDFLKTFLKRSPKASALTPDLG